MDLKINLPTEECTCDAKLFYDKYRKQVDAFIKNELENATTSGATIDKRPIIKTNKSSTTAFESGKSKQTYRSKKQYRRRLLLPKIRGAREESEDESEDESESVTSSSTKTYLPKIKAGKKWSEDYTSSSLETTILRPSSISTLDVKETDQDLKPPKKFKMYVEKPKKFKAHVEKIIQKKRMYKERRTDDTSLSQDEYSTAEDVTETYEHKKPLLAEEELSIASYDYRTKTERLSLSKKKKEDNFIAYLIAKAKKEGLDENLIAEMLAKARKTDQEEDLLNALIAADKEGKINALLFAMMEVMDTAEFGEIVSTQINEYKEKKRKSLVLKLEENFKSTERDNYIADLIAKAKREGLDENLIAEMLAEARKTGQEEDLINALVAADKEGKLDALLFAMTEVMDTAEFGKMVSAQINEQKEKKRKSLVLKIVENYKSNERDDNYIADLIAKAQELDPDDELLFMLSKATEEDNLNSLISNLSQAKNQGQLDDTLAVLVHKGKRQQTIHLMSTINAIAEEQGNDNTFINNMLSKAKESGKKDELMSMLMKAKTRGTLYEVINVLANVSSDEEPLNVLTRFTLKQRKSHSDESSDDDEREIDVIPVKSKQPRQLQRKYKAIKKVDKTTKDLRAHKVSTAKKGIQDTRESILEAKPTVKDSKIEKMKLRLLNKRQYSFRNTLPDVNYDLITRHKLATVEFSEPERSDEEEQVYEKKIDKRVSRHYRESFLRKIYGGRKIGPTLDTDDTSASSSSYSVASKRRDLPSKKLKMKKQQQPTTLPSRPIKKHIVNYAKKDLFHAENEYSSDSDSSSIEILLDKKISKICEISGEEHSERGYLVGFRYKDDDDIGLDWRKKPEKSNSVSESNYSGEWMSRARRRAILYFDARKIDDFFHFLGAHLVCDKPGDPIYYLINLLENCIHYRSGNGKPPLLFEHCHIESLYYSMDILNEGFISLDQYRTGMETLFIKEFKETPRTNKKNMVLKDTFIYEALKGQRVQLKDMLRGASNINFCMEKNSNSPLGSIWSKIDLYHDG